jgi:NAD(P)-dependent dehydrogenase (short-subunit alcohol dehydrogenase family)
MRLRDKVALITGGYGGMGRASARLFAQEGATVFIAGRSEERGDALAQEINQAGGRAHFVQLEVTDQNQWDAAVAQVKKTAGAMHVLMNIVGSNALVRFPKVDIEEWNKIFEINVTGTLRGIQTCAPLIKESGGGSIVNIGSVAGITGNFGTGYSASKWALEGLSRSAAYVYADWGIRCNVIQPGWIETDLTASMSSNLLVRKMQSSAMNNTVLLRRSGKAEEIAYTALFLASDESSYITGTDIVVDGGWFSSAPYLANERSHHMLSLLDKKEALEEFLQLQVRRPRCYFAGATGDGKRDHDRPGTLSGQGGRKHPHGATRSGHAADAQASVMQTGYGCFSHLDRV